VGGVVVADPQADLATDHDLLPTAPERAPELHLALAPVVGVGGVEGGDSEFDGAPHDGVGRVVGELAEPGGTQHDLRDQKAAAAEGSVSHSQLLLVAGSGSRIRHWSNELTQNLPLRPCSTCRRRNGSIFSHPGYALWFRRAPKR